MPGSPFRGKSHVKAEQQDIAVLHDILLALNPQLARFLCPGFTFARDVIIVRYRFAGDEPAFEVLVDDSGGPRRFGALDDGPGPRLFRAAGEIS